jgi:hypothetical protein
MIVRRFEAATGNPAVLVETGETFEALATQGAGTGVGLRAGSSCRRLRRRAAAEERELLPVKRARASTAEVRGSNPLSSVETTVVSPVQDIDDGSEI